MRTTVESDADTAKVVEQLRKESGKGVSEAVNELIRRAVLAPETSHHFVQRTHPLGLVIDVSNVSDAIDFRHSSGSALR